jgi:hypothetical protein
VYLLSGIQNSLDSLNEYISREKETALPKKKFTFARKQPTAGAAKLKPAEEVKEQLKVVQNIVSNDLSIKDVTGTEIRKTEEEYAGKENVIIENLENCEVYLPFKIKSLYVKKMTNCKIFAGCISGASFINQAVDCELHMCSH